MLIRDSRDLQALDWEKTDGLIPAIVQDAFDGRVLMQAYMNPEALAHTLDNGAVWCRVTTHKHGDTDEPIAADDTHLGDAPSSIVKSSDTIAVVGK